MLGTRLRTGDTKKVKQSLSSNKLYPNEGDKTQICIFKICTNQIEVTLKGNGLAAGRIQKGVLQKVEHKLNLVGNLRIPKTRGEEEQFTAPWGTANEKVER